LQSQAEATTRDLIYLLMLSQDLQVLRALPCQGSKHPGGLYVSM